MRKYRILHFSEGRKDSFETQTSPIDRARRVLSGAIMVRVGASRLANRLVKYWVLGVFGVVSGIFGAQRRVILKHRPVQSIELVELYLEPWLSDLEPVVWRIGSDKTNFHSVFWYFSAVFRVFLHFGKVFRGDRSVQSIELVELYLEPWLSDLEPTV